MKDRTSGEKKAKKDKKDKTEHHHHHHHHHDEKKHRRHHRDKTTDKGIENAANSKPKGSAPVPEISLTSRIVQEMHADPLPSPTSPSTSPKEVSVGKGPITSEAVKITAKAPLPTENMGFIATLFKWVKENMLQPTFSRQKQISDAYSNQFSQTLTAIQKRFSANDARIETRAAGKALRFSGTKDDKATMPTVDLSVTTPKPKTTIH